ncbi:unnamed protein product [Pleuronectes platessa]|uniref:Uncharacterized protein n=1 Tax=Pleuronectes platessa TaxID=8262 RepID=A0A9N7U0Y9_PLEPL|nr:unnamed protein product [Pleuronectes platessa]
MCIWPAVARSGPALVRKPHCSSGGGPGSGPQSPAGSTIDVSLNQPDPGPASDQTRCRTTESRGRQKPGFHVRLHGSRSWVQVRILLGSSSGPPTPLEEEDADDDADDDDDDADSRSVLLRDQVQDSGPGQIQIQGPAGAAERRCDGSGSPAPTVEVKRDRSKAAARTQGHEDTRTRGHVDARLVIETGRL